MKNKQVVVLGQRRSGTSLTSGILYHLGIPMGEEATPEQTSERNPYGFFEDKEFNELSNNITQYVNSLRKEGRKPTAAKIENKFDDKIKELVEKRSKDGEVWGFKDVNQVKTHKFFMKHLDNPYYVTVMRNPVDTARSFWNWHKEVNEERGKDFYDCLQHVLQKNQLMIKLMSIIEGELIMTSYDRALRNPEETVDNIIDFLEIEVSDEQRQNAIDHIKEPVSENE